MEDIEAVEYSKPIVPFKAYHCPSCHEFIKTVRLLERHLTTCTERVKHGFLNSVCELGETPFD